MVGDYCVYISFRFFISHKNGGGGWIWEHLFADGGFAVTFFFLLSGFGVFYGYKGRFIKVSRSGYLHFIARRLKKIYPAYILSEAYILIYQFLKWDKTVSLNIRLLATLKKLLYAASMTQSWIYTKLTLSGNNPAWYISCIFFMYIISPFLLKAIERIRKSCKNAMTCYFCVFSLLCIEIVLILKFSADYKTASTIIYYTPIARTLEYILGMLLGAIVESMFCENRFIHKKCK